MDNFSFLIIKIIMYLDILDIFFFKIFFETVNFNLHNYF